MKTTSETARARSGPEAPAGGVATAGETRAAGDEAAAERAAEASAAARELTELEPRRGWAADVREIAGDLWSHRDLLYQLTRRDIRIRYKQAVMGFGWALFMPFVIVMAGILVRLAMAQVSGSPLEMDEIVGVAVKSLPWAFFVGAIGFATPSLTGNINLVTKIYFPREVLPLSSTLAQTFDTVVAATVLLLVLPLLGVTPGWTWLWIPVMAAFMFLFTAAAALFLSCANLFFRDVKYIVQVLLMFGVFFTPVFFEPAMFGALGSKVIMLNPISPMIEGLRLAVTEGHNLLVPLVEQAERGGTIVHWHPWYLGLAAVWSIGGLAGASLLFHRSEYIFAEYV